MLYDAVDQQEEPSVNKVTRRVVAFAALVGALALLLADSADPACEVVPFEQTYSVTTDCVPGTEVVRISVGAGPSAQSPWPTAVAHVEGDLLVIAAELVGDCEDEGDAADYSALTLQLGGATGADGGATVPYTCQVELGGEATGECRADGESNPTCNVTVTPT